MDAIDDIADVAELVLSPFFRGSTLEDALPAICRETFSFPVPLRGIGESTAVLELFHGPTAAFKDIGVGFLAACLSRSAAPEGRLRTIIAATSGDTGGAVAAAFHGRPSTEVVVLYPEGLISPRQERQIAGWGGNVRAFRVRGTFDDCQRMAKELLGQPGRLPDRHLCSANSINVGRLLPQVAYHVAAGLWYERTCGESAGVVVPSGNLGNAAAALWAQKMGGKLREVILATNANRTVADYLAGDLWRPRPSVRTLATAMDVGDPSNMERVRDLFGDDGETRATLRAFSIGDEEIKKTIQRCFRERGDLWDPHTATAITARKRVGSRHWIVISTAHPAKFEQVVQPLIGRTVPNPPSLDRPEGDGVAAMTVPAKAEAVRCELDT